MNPFPSTAFKNAVLGRTVELVPLLEVYLVDGAYAYASDRAMDLSPHGGLNYQARLVDWSGITMAIDLTNAGGTPSSSATFTLSNVDRVMDAAADQHMFQRGSVVFKVYAPAVINGGGYLVEAVRTIWVGYVESVSYDDQVFTLSCKDGFFDLTLPLPRRRFSRTCEWEFDDGLHCPYSGFGYTNAGGSGGRLSVPDLAGVFAETAYPNNTGGFAYMPPPVPGLGDFGPDIGQAGIGAEGYLARPGLTQCDKTFGDQAGDNGCMQHSMARFFGAQRYVTSWAMGRTGAGGIGGFFSGGNWYTSYSSLNENIFDQGLPLVYCNQSTGYTLNPTLFQWRPEQQFMAAECVICEGPIGTYMPPQAGQADYLVDGIGDVLANALPPHQGQNPAHANVGVARSPGRIGDTLLWEQIAGDLMHSDTPPIGFSGYPEVYFSGASGFFVRVADQNAGVNSPNQSQTSATSTPDVYAHVLSGRRVWVYFSDGAGNFSRQYNPDVQGGNGNPAWIILDMILEAFDMKYAVIERHYDLIDLQSFIDSAAYFGEYVASLQGINVQRYWFAGIVADLSPATDHIDSALRDCHAFRFFRNGKIAIHPFTACQFDQTPRPGFQEFVNMKLAEFKPSVPKPEYNEIWLNYADKDFDFQKNVAQVYSQDYQALMGMNGHPFKMTKTLNMMGTPYVEQATRIGLRMLRHTLGGTSPTEWAQVREMDIPSTFMMTELEPGDVTYVSHSLVPGSGDWVRISSVTINKDWSVTFKARSWRQSAYDDILATDPFVDLAKFPHQLQIHSGLGIVYHPNPQLQWADVDPIAAIDNVGMRLSWQLYPAHVDNARLRFIAVFRSLDSVLASGGYLKAEVNGLVTTWTVATDSADFSTDPTNMRNVYLCGAEQVAVTAYQDNNDGTATLTVTRNVNGTDPESHQKYDWISHISFLDELPNPKQVQALVSLTQYIDPADTSS
jgi:hypothetical protein